MPEYSSPGSGPKPGAVVFQLARLGDFLQTTPLLAALAQTHPGEPRTVVIPPALAPLAAHCRHLEGAFFLDPADLEAAARAREPGHLRLALLRGFLNPLWKMPARTVYNLNLSRLAAVAAMGWPRAERRGWRVDPGGQRIVGEDWTPFMMRLVADRRLTRLHLSDILASYARPAGPPLPALDYRVEDGERQAIEAFLPPRPRVVLQLGANNDLRRWPIASFAGLARGLMDQGASLILTGTGAEQPLARRLIQALGVGGEKLTNLMGATDVAGLAAALAGADLAVSADTGTLHLATAVGTKVLALFMGPAQAHETGPYGPGHLVLQARDQCGPCLEDRPACGGRAECRGLITPEAAFLAAQALLAGAGAGEAAGRLALPPGVEPLEGIMDRFGQRYRQLTPRPLTAPTGLALAYREAGRVLMRPAYAAGEEELAGEIRAEYLPPNGPDTPALAGLARGAQRLAAALEAGDPARARRIGEQAPGLAALTSLAGPEAPERLEQAVRAAHLVLNLMLQ